MDFAAIEQIARAVLYEGYLLYPYRYTALKNRQRWMFGRLVPRDYSQHFESDPWRMQTQCLLLADPDTVITMKLRFLQLAAGRAAQDEQALEREVVICQPLEQLSAPHDSRFCFSADAPISKLDDNDDRLTSDSQCPRSAIEGNVKLSASAYISNPSLFTLTVEIQNLTPQNLTLWNVDGHPGIDQVLFSTLLSTHVLLGVNKGELLSMIDPPAAYAEAASGCCNIGTWPVLVGPEKGRAMLSSPIILYDYPQIAPESPGDLFDGTEIDELLTLRIQTLTDDEKQQMHSTGENVRHLLARTEALSEDHMRRLHGRLMAGATITTHNAANCFTELSMSSTISPGDHVRIQPRAGADALDILLKGMTAKVVAIEQDLEGRLQVAVILDDDPGSDLGMQGLPGHRFYFRPDELERDVDR